MDEFIREGWLSKEEVILHRMRSFHRSRVGELKSGQARDREEKDGKLVIHCIPEQAIVSRNRFSVSELRKYGEALRAPNCSYWNPRVNADGYACSESPCDFSTYSQLFRDGRLEAVLTRASFYYDNAHILADSACESAILDATKQYLGFCGVSGVAPPVWLFCTLIDVAGARYRSNWRGEDRQIDQPVVELPEMELATFDTINVDTHLRPLLDCIWNAMGFDGSPHYDEAGNRRALQ